MGRSHKALLQSAIPGFLSDTPVLTSYGYKPISEMVVGDVIITPDGHTDTVREIKKYGRIACAETTPYIIPKGLLGVKKDIYLSPTQRIIAAQPKIYREVKNIEWGITQAVMKEGETFDYYNIRLTSSNEYAILVGGICAEPLPANEGVEISHTDFKRVIRETFGSRPEDKIIVAIFKTCKKLPTGMIHIPIVLFNPVSMEE